jgi:hypothetical protein
MLGDVIFVFIVLDNSIIIFMMLFLYKIHNKEVRDEVLILYSNSI